MNKEKICAGIEMMAHHTIWMTHEYKMFITPKEPNNVCPVNSSSTLAMGRFDTRLASKCYGNHTELWLAARSPN